MGQKPRPNVQVCLRLLPGAEPWVRVEHHGTWFKVPLLAPVEEVFYGATHSWSAQRARHPQDPQLTVRVAAEYLWSLERDATAWRASLEGALVGGSGAVPS